MNQKSVTITLIELMTSPDGWGHIEGREVHSKLLSIVESNPGVRIFRISLKGVDRTDASFPRESVMEIARRYRGDKGFCLINFPNDDLRDNWGHGADKKDQPIVIWNDDAWELIGPEPSKGNLETLKYALSKDFVKTSDVAKALNMKLTNASTKLKLLWEKGFLLRMEESADTGGVEFVYYRIK